MQARLRGYVDEPGPERLTRLRSSRFSLCMPVSNALSKAPWSTKRGGPSQTDFEEASA